VGPDDRHGFETVREIVLFTGEVDWPLLYVVYSAIFVAGCTEMTRVETADGDSLVSPGSAARIRCMDERKSFHTLGAALNQTKHPHGVALRESVVCIIRS
jgi:hypothetical protein